MGAGYIINQRYQLQSSNVHKCRAYHLSNTHSLWHSSTSWCTNQGDASSNCTTTGRWTMKPAPAASASCKSQPTHAAPAAGESPSAHVSHEPASPSAAGHASGATVAHWQEKGRGNNKKASLPAPALSPQPLQPESVLVKSIYLFVKSHSCQVAIGLYQFSFCQIQAADQILNKFVIKPGRWLSDQISYCRSIISIQPWVHPAKASRSYMEFQRKKHVLTNSAMLWQREDYTLQDLASCRKI